MLKLHPCHSFFHLPLLILPLSNPEREEFAQHGMSEYVTVSHRNVCKEGFGLENAVDAGS